MGLLKYMKVHYRILIGVIAIAAAVIFFKFLIGESVIALFDARGQIAAGERTVIITMVLLMLIVVIPMFVFLFAFAWKYRAGNKDAKYDPDKMHGPWKEIILWLIPAALAAALAVITWQSAHALDPFKPIDSPNEPITIQVVALPWKWLFIYPKQNIATVNFIQFPEKTPVHFELTADAPVSSFWIPQLGSQIYAMAAMQTQLDLIASTTGEYVGKDTEINGKGYAGMKFTAKSSSQADFDAWVAQVKAGTDVLNEAAYSVLAEQSENNPAAYYASVEGDMFANIMMKFMAPGAATSMPAMPGMQM